MKTYEVPSKWYEGVYADRTPCCSAARPFSMVHDSKSDECWLVVHGYRGYPGEMVRPADDLYEAGFDVFVPRTPGHGTSGDDFVASRAKDWVGLYRNALADLCTRYSKVHLVGHSLGCSIVAAIGCRNPKVGKMVFLSPSFTCSFLTAKVMRGYRRKAHTVDRIPTPWQSDPRYRMHYENAPCDDAYLGAQYWSFDFPRQLVEFQRTMRWGIRALRRLDKESLVVNALGDPYISMPSAELYSRILGKRANVVGIENATHCIQYDIDAEAEDKAIAAVMDFACDRKENR